MSTETPLNARQRAFEALTVVYDEDGQWRVNYSCNGGNSLVGIVSKLGAQSACAQLVGIMTDFAEQESRAVLAEAERALRERAETERNSMHAALVWAMAADLLAGMRGDK